MTRAERAAETARKKREKIAEMERDFKERLAEEKEEARQAEAREREEIRKADHRRRYHWGAVAQESGLFAWGNADWQAICGVLARLRDTPNPAAVLEALLADPGDVSVQLEELRLSRFQTPPSFSAPDQGGKSGLPALETAEESDCKEVTKQEPAVAGVVAGEHNGGTWWKR